MAGTTPKYAWPFPTGTDRVMDGDNAMEALARAIETSLGSGAAVGVTPGAGVQTASTKVYRRTGIGFLMLQMDTTTPVSPGFVFMTVPAGYRPITEFHMIISQPATLNTGSATIYADGTVKAQANFAATLWIGSVAYPLA